MEKVFIAGLVVLLGMFGLTGTGSAALVKGYLYDNETFIVDTGETRHYAAHDLLQDFASNNGDHVFDDEFEFDIINFNFHIYGGTTYLAFLSAG